jgi:NodT family efflux transporter outer membrane factor (OMF) lipoprotein
MKLVYLLIAISITFSSCLIVKEDDKLKKSVIIPNQIVDIPKSENSVADLPFSTLIKDSTLVRFINEALSKNLDLKVMNEMVNINLITNRQGRFLLFPSLQGAAKVGGDRFGKYTLNGVGNFDSNLSPNLEANQRVNENFTPELLTAFQTNWELDIWGRLRNTKKSRRMSYLSSVEAQKFFVTQIVASVSQYYFEMVALNLEFDILQRNIKLQEDALSIIEDLKNAGRANELAVKQFNAQLLNTQALEIELRNEMKEAETNLAILLGRFPNDIVFNQKSFTNIIADSLISVGNPALILAKRPDIKEAELKLSSAGFDVGAAKAAMYPTISISGYAGFNAFNSGLLFDPASLAFGLISNLVAPIFNQGALRADLKIKKASKMQRFYEYQNTIIKASNEINLNYYQLNNLNKIVGLKQKEAEVVNDAVSTSSQLFRNGYANYLEVIFARRDVLRAELEYVNSMKNHNLAKINLYKSLGGGWQ